MQARKSGLWLVDVIPRPDTPCNCDLCGWLLSTNLQGNVPTTTGCFQTGCPQEYTQRSLLSDLKPQVVSELERGKRHDGFFGVCVRV